VRLVHNEAQGGWVLLAPERVFKADTIAVEIVKRCTGEATLAAIVDDLATTFRRRASEFSPTSRRCCAGWPTNGCLNCDRRARPLCRIERE
jgi:coenzyme PQQ biosynthesis protein PqqD